MARAAVSGPLARWEGEPVSAWQDAWGVPLVEAWASIGSTNDRALALAAAGATPFSVVLADEQTAGRGRRGAAWLSAPGAGLWMSVVLPTDSAPRAVPLLVGLAAAEAVQAATGAAVGLKWPNDLMIGARKVGGILCEATHGAAVAGIGINLRTPPGGFPDELSGRATALDVEGANALSVSHLVGLILDRLEPLVGAGPSTLEGESLTRLRARDVLAGRVVETEERGRGTAVGIGEDGGLLLERPDGSRVTVSSGSVRPV